MDPQGVLSARRNSLPICNSAKSQTIVSQRTQLPLRIKILRALLNVSSHSRPFRGLPHKTSISRDSECTYRITLLLYFAKAIYTHFTTFYVTRSPLFQGHAMRDVLNFLPGPPIGTLTPATTQVSIVTSNTPRSHSVCSFLSTQDVDLLHSE